MREPENQLDVFDRLFNDFYNREYVKMEVTKDRQAQTERSRRKSSARSR